MTGLKKTICGIGVNSIINIFMSITFNMVVSDFYYERQ